MRGLARLRRLTRRLRTRADERAVILCYHRVAQIERDPWSLCVSPGNFDAHLALIAESGRAISLQEMLDKAAKRSSLAGRIVVTFDDGYADNLHTALPLLERHGVPATFYITTGCIGRDTEFWSDEIERRCANDADLEKWRDQILPLEAAARDSALAPLPPARPTHRTLTLPELRTLAASPFVEIGAHTIDHLLLPAHPAETQRAEILGSKQWLETELGRPVRHFSYPYGERSAETERLVAEAGFDSAVTCASEYVAHDSTPFALPRFFVHDWPRETFAAHLDDWLR